MGCRRRVLPPQNLALAANPIRHLAQLEPLAYLPGLRRLSFQVGSRNWAVRAVTGDQMMLIRKQDNVHIMFSVSCWLAPACRLVPLTR